MALGPKKRIANRPLKPEEMAQLMGTRSAFYGCPDTRQEITLGPTLAQLLEGKVTHAALAGYLAAVKSNYEIHGHVAGRIFGGPQCPRSDRSHRADRREATQKGGVVQDVQRRAGGGSTQTGRQVAGAGRCHLAEEPEALADDRPQLIAPENWNYVRQWLGDWVDRSLVTKAALAVEQLGGP